MKTDDFDFYLPEKLIAQTPLEKRDASRLLVLDKKTGDISHKHFVDIIDYMEKGDTLVLNDTKVMPARLCGVKEETGAIVELLLLKDDGNKAELNYNVYTNIRGIEYKGNDIKLITKFDDVLHEYLD